MRKIQLITLLLCLSCIVQAQSYVISTLSGTGLTAYNNDNIQSTAANLNFPAHMDFDAAGNLYFADFNHARIRKINTTTGVITTAAGSGAASYGGDGGAATLARMSQPYGVAFDTSGNMFIASYNDCHIRRVDASTGLISTIAGTTTIGFAGDSGPSTSAQIHYPISIRTDRAGNVYFTDNANHRLRKIDLQTGNIYTICGTNLQNFNGNNIQARTANLGNPQGIAIDAAGNIFIAELGNNRIRKITASTGIITTVAGNGTSGSTGDGGAATSATLNSPYDVAVDAAGNIYIVDVSHRVRKVNATTGIITTIAGTGTAGSTGDGGLATLATLNGPQSIAVGPNGKVYIGEATGLRLRVLTPCTAPAVTSAPSPRTSCGPFAASFAASASGTSPSLQWQRSTDGGVTFANISGATSSPLSFSADSTMNGYKYRAVFTNGCGSDTSAAALLTVYRTIGSTISAAICSGSSYAGYTASGTYTDHYTSVTGCDSARTLTLTVNPLPSITLGPISSLCYSDSPQVAFLTYSNASAGINVFSISGNGYGTYRNIPLFSSPITIPIPAGQAAGTYSGSFVMTNTSTGCSSAPYAFQNTINPKVTSSIITSICAGSVYGRHGSSGIYTDTFPSMYGCDSIVTLTLTVINNASSTIPASICAGQSFDGYSISGTYTDHFRSAAGCDSTRTLLLTVTPNIVDTFYQTICTGSNYAGYTASGIYTDHFTSASGCDSARTVILTVNPSISASVSITADRIDLCNTYPMDTFRATPVNGGVSPNYVWYKNGSVIGTNTATLGYMMLTGGDSIWCVMTSNAACANPNIAMSNKIGVRMLPNVTPAVSITATATTLCAGATRDTFTIVSMAHAGTSPVYRWYKNGSVFSTAATYVAPLLNNGDSIWFQLSSNEYCANPANVLSNRIHITVAQAVSSTVSISICAGSSYAGHTAAGTYTDHYSSAAGCDSARTLILTTTANITSTVSVSICAGQSYAGHTAAGTYTDHYSSATGCDSARTLNLSVLAAIRTSPQISVCAGSSYAGYNVSGTYIDTFISAAGCDSIRTLNLTVNPNASTTVNAFICSGSSYAGHTTSGSYTDHYNTLAGCDSVRTLVLSVFSPATSSRFDTISAGGSVTIGSQTFNSSGIYTVTLANASSHGCDSIVTLRLYVRPATTCTSVSVTANNTNLDVQSSRVMTASPVSAGSSPVYNWYMNGALINGIHGSVLSYGGALGSGDQIYCTLTTSAAVVCGPNSFPAGQTVSSNIITFTKTGSSVKDIITFTMPNQLGNSAINTGTATVNAIVSTAPAQRTAIHPTRLYTTVGSSYGPSYAINRNFSQPVTYTVAAQNGSTKVWTVIVVDQNGNKTGGSTAEKMMNGQNAMSIYPNPAASYLLINAIGGPSAAVITILDADGRVMYHQKLPVADQVNHEIDLQGFASGAYIIHLAQGDKIQTRQFVISK